MKLGGINLFLKCDHDPLKTPLRYMFQQILVYWKIIYKHNFSPHNILLWSCRCMVFRNKSLFYEN